jgi:spermidine synthase
VIGLASGVTAGAVARHPVERVTILEIAPAVVAAARRFDEANGRVLDDSRVEVVLDDARSHLLARDDLYDVITSQPSNPWVAGVANLFTLEFYRLVRSRLTDGGIFCQWIQAYRMEPRDLAGVVAAFRTVFPMATLWEESGGGGDYFLLGGAGPIRIAPGLGETAGPAWEDLRRAGIDGPAALLARFVAGPDGLARIAAGARRHTDDNLYLEWRAPLALFRDTLQAGAAFLNRHREPPAALLPPGFLEARPDLAAALRHETARRADRLEALLALQPADLSALSDPFLAAGIESLRAGRFDEALARIQQAVAANPGSAQALWLLGEAYAGAGLDGAAAVALRAAVTTDPRIGPAWTALGRRLLAAGLREEAEAAFLEAVRAAPGGRAAALARNNLGAVRLARGDPGAAEADFVAAIGIDPALAAASANLGLVLRRRGDLPGAERRYREAIAIDPLNTDARYNLARLLIDSGRAEEARAALREILAIDPTDATARDLLARISHRGSSRDRADGRHDGLPQRRAPGNVFNIR